MIKKKEIKIMNDEILKNEIERMKKIEELELKYLNKYYYFLKFAEDEMFLGFKTKEKIKDDWW